MFVPGNWRHLARMEPGAPAPKVFEAGDFCIDADAFRVSIRGQDVRLTPKEFELLLQLARNAGRVVTHRKLLNAIWGPDSVEQPEHLRVLVGQLRKKVETGDVLSYIVTEPWIGYRLEPSGEVEVQPANHERR